MDWPTWLELCLDRAGLSQAELARRAQVGRQRITQWKRRDSVPSWPDCCRMADALGLEGTDRQLFLDLAAIEAAPPESRDRLRELAAQAAMQPANDGPQAHHVLRVYSDNQALRRRLAETASELEGIMGRLGLLPPQSGDEG